MACVTAIHLAHRENRKTSFGRLERMRKTPWVKVFGTLRKMQKAGTLITWHCASCDKKVFSSLRKLQFQVLVVCFFHHLIIFKKLDSF